MILPAAEERALHQPPLLVQVRCSRHHNHKVSVVSLVSNFAVLQEQLCAVNLIFGIEEISPNSLLCFSFLNSW